jgi:hypothetical protein
MRIGFVYSEILAFASAHSVGTEFLASRNRVLPAARQDGKAGACPCNQYAATIKCSMSWLGRHMGGQHHDHVSQFSSCLTTIVK